MAHPIKVMSSPSAKTARRLDESIKGSAVLDDLMAVVEVFCPTWPPRDTFAATKVWVL